MCPDKGAATHSTLLVSLSVSACESCFVRRVTPGRVVTAAVMETTCVFG